MNWSRFRKFKHVSFMQNNCKYMELGGKQCAPRTPSYTYWAWDVCRRTELRDYWAQNSWLRHFPLNRIRRDVIALIISLCFFYGWLTYDVIFDIDKITNEQWWNYYWMSMHTLLLLYTVVYCSLPKDAAAPNLKTSFFKCIYIRCIRYSLKQDQMG